MSNIENINCDTICAGCPAAYALGLHKQELEQSVDYSTNEVRLDIQIAEADIAAKLFTIETVTYCKTGCFVLKFNHNE